MRTPAGIFMSDLRNQVYCKPALTLDEQIDLLAARGLTVSDRDKARHYPRYVGYYRLSGYFLTLQQRGNVLQLQTSWKALPSSMSWTSSVKSYFGKEE